MGLKNKRNHTLCVRCGSMSYHKQKARCSSCGFPEAKKRNPGSYKVKRKRGYGTGRLRYVKNAIKSKKAGFKGNKVLAGLRSSNKQ